MTDLSAAGIRPRFPMTNDEKAHIFGLIKDLMIQVDQVKGPLRDYVYFSENLQALLQGRARAVPPVVPYPVPYVQDDWSDLTQVPIKALNLSVTLTNLLRREGAKTVWDLLIMPEDELFGENKPRNLGPKSTASVKQALASHDLQLVTDPKLISAKDASRSSLTTTNLLRIGDFNISAEDFQVLFVNLSISTLEDLSHVTCADIRAELIANDYPCIKKLIGLHAVSMDEDGEQPIELSEARIDRMVDSFVSVIDSILGRHGLRPLRL
jgi:hypothetical protein